MKNNTFRNGRQSAASLAVFAFLALLATTAHGQGSPLSFSKSFSPSTIGPGSISTLTFTIESTSPTPVTGLAFTDTLPAGMTIAEPAGATTDCGASAQVTAPAGGTTITLTDGSLPGAVEFVSCQVSVNITASTLGVLTNTSGTLSSDQGTATAATADLTVAANRPGFSKSFSPASITIGQTSTLTFTIDNSANGSQVLNLLFTDALPAGLAVASPANTTMTCTAGNFAPTAGATTLTFSGGFVQAGETCTISVEVEADDSAGPRENLTSDMTSTVGSSGKAGDVLDVRVDPLIKLFTDDPVPPGGTATLAFSIRNLDRSSTLTDIGFTDDLDATLSGLVAVPPLPAEPCGAGSTLSGTSLLTLSGGSLAPGAVCEFEVTVQVPAGATPGSYPNTTSSMTGQLGGDGVVFDPASDNLVVDVVPLMTKTFLNSPVGAGQSVDVEFTITNTSQTSSASNIAFNDNLSQFLGGTVAGTLPTTPCNGTGSLVQSFPNGDATLFFSNGSLAAGASCTFTVPIQIPAGTPYGLYDNVTSDVTATIDAATRTGPPAQDTLEVLGAPAPTKSFIDDPVDPGGTATLQFTLTHDEFAPGDATAISFTDDLDATLSGLVATGLPQNDVCGAGSQLSGTSTITLSGGTLAPGETCSFSVVTQVPVGAEPGIYTNTTSEVTATVSGEPATGRTASDDLLVSGLEASKDFIDSPVLPGQITTLEFTLVNDNPSLTATDITFTDDLTSVILGLAAVGLPASDICGVGSSLSGTNTLIFTGGTLGPQSSCTFTVDVQVPPGAASGIYSNFTSDVVATFNGSNIPFPPASALLEIDDNIIGLSKRFTDDPAVPGGSVTLEFSVTNLSDDDDITDINFTDDLDATMPGLASTSGTLNDVCGTGSQLSGTNLLTLTGGNLLAGQSCTFSVTLALPASVPTGSNFINTTSTAFGDVGGIGVTGSPASDELQVNQVNFAKAFDGPTVAGGTLGLTFTLENQGGSAVSALAFTDDLDAVLAGLTATNLPLTDVCGPGSQISGGSLLTFSGGELEPGDSCSFVVDLAVPAAAAPGSYVNTTSDLTSGGLLVSEPAAAQFSVEPPPTFGKVFSPNAIAVGGTTTLAFQIDNSASVLAANNLSFTDNLPAGLQVAATPNASTTCTGGTITATAGAGVVSLTGSSVAAGASCTVSVDVTGPTEGTYVNVSSDLTSSSGNSGTATDTLDVVSDEFAFSKSFRTAPVLPGGLVEMELSVVNGSAFPLTDISFSDDLDAVLPGLAAEGLPLNDVCGTGSQVAGTSVVTLTGGNLAAGASCTIVVPVRVPAGAQAGTFTNTTSAATATREGISVDAPPAAADLEIALAQFAKSFNPAVTPEDSSVTLSFSITNPDPANSVSNLQFSDDLDAFVSGMTAAGTPINDVCGTGSQLAGSSTLTLTGGTLPAGGNCNFQVTVNVPAGAADGIFTNTTSAVSGDIDGNAITIDAASAELEIEPPPVFAKAFSPQGIGVDGVSTLTLTIDNSASTLPADSLAFVDDFPGPMAVANPANATNTCGGTLTAAAGNGQIDLSGGSVAAGASCAISVNVTTSQLGVNTNVTGDLTSTLGNSGPATADLEVSAAPAFTKAFAPQTVGVGVASTLTLTIDNSGGTLPADSLAFVDDLPGPMEVASPANATNTCGGTLTATAGSGQIDLSGGSVAAGSTCEISVDVSTSQVGMNTNLTGELTSTLGNSGTATADLEVTTAPTFAKSFSPDMIAFGETATLTFTIDNTASPVPADSLAFVDPLPTGMFVATPANASNSCGGTVSAPEGGDTVSLSNGSVAAGAQCTVSVEVIITVGGTLTNITEELSSNLGSSGTARGTVVQFVQVPTIHSYWLLMLALLLGAIAWFHFRQH